MKLVTSAKVTVLAIEKKEASGGYNESYRIAIMQGSEVGTLSCTKDVYETLKDKEMYKPHIVNLELNEYEGKTTKRITGVTPDPVK